MASIGHFYAPLKKYYLSERKLSPQFFTLFPSLMTYLVNIKGAL